MEGEEDSVEQKVTKMIIDNSFHPIFNSQFEFEIKNFERSALMFCVYNRTPNNLILWNCAMLTSLRCGYRMVNLLDEYGNEAGNSKLFCKL